MQVREGRILISSATDPDFGSGYYVQTLPVGAQVVSVDGTGLIVTVRAGHGFVANQKLIQNLSASTFRTVQSVTSTTVTINTAISGLALGDILVNLGTDGGSSTPLYHDATIPTYADMAGGVANTYSTVTTSANGAYRYWVDGTVNAWELARDTTGAPYQIITDTFTRSDASSNVKTYGAKGDGVTDDAVAIQLALTAVASTGGAVYMPAGVYITSTALWIKSNTKLYGDGIGVTILKRKANTLSATASAAAYAGNSILQCGSAANTEYTAGSPGANITVVDLTLDGNYTNQSLTTINNGAYGFASGHTYGSENGGNIDGLTIARVAAINIIQDGFNVSNSRNVLIADCVTYLTGQTLVAATKNGITIAGAPANLGTWCRNIVISNNRVSYCGDATTRAAGNPSSEGIVIVCGDDVVISGNDVSHVDYGIEGTFTTSTTYTNYNWAITGNTIHDLTESTVAAQVGITVARDATHRLKGLSVTGNSLYNINHNGINIGSADSLVVSGNVLHKTNLDADGTYFTGIDIVVSDGATISDNVVAHIGAPNGTYGIRLFGCTSAVASGNTVTNDNASSTGANIVLNVSAQNCLVTGNRLTGNKYGVQISASGTNSGNVVEGNQVTGALTASYIDSSGQTNAVNNPTFAAVTVTGAATVGTTLGVTGAATLGSAVVTGSATVGTTLGVTGAATLSSTATQSTANAATWIRDSASELLTLSTSGLTTDTSANLLPINAIIEAVCCRVTTTITTTTNWAVGDLWSSARFSSANATLASGTTSVGLNQWNGALATTLALSPPQAAAAKVRITCTGSNPGAGAIRITVFYRQFVAPTS